MAITLSLIMAFALAAITTGTADAKKKSPKKAKVTVKVQTKNQAALIKAKKLIVRVKSTGKTRVVLRGNGFKKKTVRFKRRGTKRVKLAWTGAGKRSLSKCGAKVVKVNAKYKRGKKNAKAKTKKRLAKSNKQCVKYVNVDLGTDPEHCDFLDSTICLQPFPNDYYTKKDASTPTGLRLNIGSEAGPVNEGNKNPKPLDVTDINRADGFSPGNLITLKVPGLDTPAAFTNSNLVPLENISAYKDADQAVLLIDAETGERQAIWAELDSNPTSVDPSSEGPGGIGKNPTNTDPVNLIIRPAKNLENGKRYIVAFRNLKDGANQPIQSPLGFRVFRDKLPTKQAPVENRRSHMYSVIDSVVSKAGVDRSSLYMAWDFTVASTESVTGRATTIRDDAFKRLGDTNLANRKIEGASPDIDVLAWCDKSNTAAATCGDNYPGIANYNPNNPTTSPVPGGDVQRTVVGYIKNVPCYLDKDGCPSGSKFAFDANDKLTWNSSYTMDVPFRCVVPTSIVSSGTVKPGGTGTYGHGLLGTLNQINATVSVANQSESTWCAANWDGFSSLDLATIIISLSDMSNFNKAADRMQQGFVNFMMLGRAMAHPDGFADEPAFTMDHNGTTPITPGSAIDTSAGADTRHYYMGISQGGIMGGALTALSPDADYGVLGVPGINYSTLLRRSVDSDEYFKMPGVGLYDNYPNMAERPLLLSMVQLLWDRGEGNGYANNLTDNPLPNTNKHEVLLRVALGDHQVSNFTADVEARTIGAKRYAPTLVPGRHNWDLS
ncbi:MAG: hypothetical protein M3Y23_04555, partial [Actinomycetota bacterium]|nr:hypothetical protein [Actinomycetota bacterium]